MQPSLLAVEAHPTELTKGIRKQLVEYVIFSSFETGSPFQFLKGALSEPQDQLKLLIAARHLVLAMDVEQFIDQLEGITHFSSVLAIDKLRIQHGVRDANKCCALRNVELSKNRCRHGETTPLRFAANKNFLDHGLLLTSKILKEQPVCE